MISGVAEDRERGHVIGDWKQRQSSAGCAHGSVISNRGETAIFAKDCAVLAGEGVETND